MPAGDYTNCVNCVKCGRGIFGYGLCNECGKTYNFGTSYDFYGTPNNTFEEFWSKYAESLSSMNKKETLNDVYQTVIGSANVQQKPTPSKEENLDTLYYEMIDNFEKGNEECDYDIDDADELDEIINELEQEANQIIKPIANVPSDESVSDTFDRFFNDQPFQKKEVKPLKRKTLVVNLYAGPGSGKSTTAAGVFFELKSRGINCELATEFVKDLVWEERHKAINNQVYIFAKQHHRVTRLLGEVDVIVTDSPLLLTLVYGKNEDVALKNLALVEHNKLWTFNCFIKRNKEYNPKGRWQSYAEARDLDRSIADMLDKQQIPYEVYFGNAEGKDKIVNKILQLIGKNNMGEYKKFSKSLFRQSDPKSRKVVKEYFTKNNIPLEDNSDKYGVDLLAKDGSLQIEVEHRLVWDGEEFPFADVNVPERKAKYFVENHICYVILSRDYSRIGMIDGKTLMKYINDDNLQESSNKFVKKGEMFFKVPKTEFKWDKI